MVNEYRIRICDRCKKKYISIESETEVRVVTRKNGECKNVEHNYLCFDCSCNLNLFLGNFEPDIK